MISYIFQIKWGHWLDLINYLKHKAYFIGVTQRMQAIFLAAVVSAIKELLITRTFLS